jgi:hypothetical protein
MYLWLVAPFYTKPFANAFKNWEQHVQISFEALSRFTLYLPAD